VGLERSPLSLVSTIEQLLGRKSSGSGLENREYGRRDPTRCPSNTLYFTSTLAAAPSWKLVPRPCSKHEKRTAGSASETWTVSAAVTVMLCP
jgi:hypothetical protein